MIPMWLQCPSTSGYRWTEITSVAADNRPQKFLDIECRSKCKTSIGCPDASRPLSFIWTHPSEPLHLRTNNQSAIENASFSAGREDLKFDKEGSNALMTLSGSFSIGENILNLNSLLLQCSGWERLPSWEGPTYCTIVSSTILSPHDCGAEMGLKKCRVVSKVGDMSREKLLESDSSRWTWLSHLVLSCIWMVYYAKDRGHEEALRRH